MPSRASYGCTHRRAGASSYGGVLATTMRPVSCALNDSYAVADHVARIPLASLAAADSVAIGGMMRFSTLCSPIRSSIGLMSSSGHRAQRGACGKRQTSGGSGGPFEKRAAMQHLCSICQYARVAAVATSGK